MIDLNPANKPFQDNLPPVPATDNLDPDQGYWTVNDSYVTRHHVIPRRVTYVPTEATSPIPLRFLDVQRIIQAEGVDYDCKEKIHDIWSDATGYRDLGFRWTGSTKFEIRRPEHPSGQYWSSGRLTISRGGSRKPKHIWPEIWRTMSDSRRARAIKEEEEEEKKIKAACEARGISEHISPDDDAEYD